MFKSAIRQYSLIIHKMSHNKRSRFHKLHNQDMYLKFQYKNLLKKGWLHTN